MTMHRKERGALIFLLGHLIVGLIGAALFTGGLMAFDLFGLWTLMSRSESPFLVGGLLFAGSAITFGSLAMGAGVMMLGEEDDDHRPEKNSDDPYA